jgi:hypothetical protein
MIIFAIKRGRKRPFSYLVAQRKLETEPLPMAERTTELSRCCSEDWDIGGRVIIVSSSEPLILLGF